MNKLDTDAIRMHVRARQFEIKAQTGISWRGKSLLLKHAADRLYGLCHDATLCEIAQMLDEQRDDKVSSDISKSRSKILVGKELEDAWDSQLISVYWFLMGYAIENLLKAILLLQNPQYYRASGKMSDIRSHNLASLCQRCNIDTDSDERATLDKLTRYIEWVGKYPIPLAAEDMLPTRKDNGTWVDGGESFDGHKTQEKLDAIWMRIWNELMQLEKDPGRSNKP